MNDRQRDALMQTLAKTKRSPEMAEHRLSRMLQRGIANDGQAMAILDAILASHPHLVDMARACADVVAPGRYVVRTNPFELYDYITVAFAADGTIVTGPDQAGFFTTPLGQPDPVSGIVKGLAQTNNEGVNGVLDAERSYEFYDVGFTVELTTPPDEAGTGINNGDTQGDIQRLFNDITAVRIKTPTFGGEKYFTTIRNSLSYGADIRTYGNLTQNDTVAGTPGATSSVLFPADCMPWRFRQPIAVPAGNKFRLPLSFQDEGFPAFPDFAGAQVLLGCRFRGMEAEVVQ